MRRLLIQLFLKALWCAALPRNLVYCLIKGVAYDFSWTFRGLPFFQRRSRSTIVIGKDFVACSCHSWNSLGVPHRAIIKTTGHMAKLQIGRNVGVSGCVISAAEEITIGNNVLVGSGAIVTDSDSHPLNADDRKDKKSGSCKPIHIEDDVFIGARAIILKGVTLGKGCVVGAGSVVTRDVPPGVVVAGNPARVVKQLSGGKEGL